MSRESIVAEIQRDIALLQQALRLLGGAKAVPIDTVIGKQKGKRKGISAAGRKRIAAAQRARWAKIRAAKKK